MKLIKKNWISSRFYTLLSIFLDFIFFLFLKNYLVFEYEQISLDFYNLGFPFLIFISYLLGKYTNPKHDVKGAFYKYKNLFFNFLLISLIISLFFYKYNFFEFSNLLFLIIQNSFLIFIFLLLQFFLEKLYFSKRRNFILLIGSEQNKKFLEDLIVTSKVSYKIDLVVFDKLDKIKNIEKYESIISCLKENQNLNNYPYFINLVNIKKGKIFSIYDWCRIKLERLPSDLINGSNNSYRFISRKFVFQFRLKRFFDLFFSLLILLLTFPIIIFSIFLIFIEDGYPFFYGQYRTGMNNKRIKIYKLRTMRTDAEKSGAKWSSENDERILFFGSIFRKSRIDELPQLFSVIKGEMSLIGPRPERPVFDEFLSKEIKFYNYRYFVKPGLSGWAQVNYPYGASIKEAKDKLSYDLFYLFNFNLFLDLLIFFKTIKILLRLEGAISLKKER